MRVLFVEPPKDYWFVMGEYLPPPTACIQLAAYLESKHPEYEIDVVDCQAEKLDWGGLEKRIANLKPDVVAVSSLATCNTYTVVRALEVAKKAIPGVVTVTGGQHFTALAEPSLREYPIIDAIVRGEGEETLREFMEAVEAHRSFANLKGLTFRNGEEIVSNPPRPLIENLNDLPIPGYRFVEKNLDAYHFKMMAWGKRYMIIEGSRGCDHNCTFCSQCSFWGNRWRTKSGKRIADEIEYCRDEFLAEFLWLTDDNFTFNARSREFLEEMNSRRLGDSALWFVQARVDDIVKNREYIPSLRKSGNEWVLLGVESGDAETLTAYKKGIEPGQAGEAIRVLEANDIFAQATMIIGSRKDTHASIEGLRRYADAINQGIAIFMILTPFPGTGLYTEAEANGWIIDRNWSHYDMIQAVMPTETLNTKEVQEELFNCYRSFFGKWGRRIEGIFSDNKFKRGTYRYMVNQGLLRQLQSLI